MGRFLVKSTAAASIFLCQSRVCNRIKEESKNKKVSLAKFFSFFLFANKNAPHSAGHPDFLLLTEFTFRSKSFSGKPP
jgi:hypothetical protein